MSYIQSQKLNFIFFIMTMLCISLFLASCSSISQTKTNSTITNNTKINANPPKQPLLSTANSALSNAPSSPRQLKPDAPKDTQIAVRVKGNAKWCYAPQFSASAQNYSYMALISCSRDEALKARYDVLSRLAYYINNTWICVTAPGSVRSSAREADMLYLSPCVINDERQQWKIKNGQFWSVDERYSIKDDGDFLYAAWAFDEKYNEHSLDSSMSEWEKTVAPAGTLNFGFFLSWEEKGVKYYVNNDSSTTEKYPLYYNVESGHIASYDAFVPRLNCMYSNLNGGDWDWVVWGKCDDTKPPKENRAFFKPVLIGNKKLALKDRNGNYLRVTHYGAHWGVPYLVKPSYMPKDTGNAASSEFNIAQEFQDWLMFISANEGDNLPYCPAPGDPRPN